MKFILCACSKYTNTLSIVSIVRFDYLIIIMNIQSSKRKLLASFNVYPWKADQSLLGCGVLRGDFAKYGFRGQNELGNVKSICKLMGKHVSDC